MSSKATHEYRGGLLVQIVSDEDLRDVLDAHGLDHAKPASLSATDEWRVAAPKKAQAAPAAAKPSAAP